MSSSLNKDSLLLHNELDSWWSLLVCGDIMIWHKRHNFLIYFIPSLRGIIILVHVPSLPSRWLEKHFNQSFSLYCHSSFSRVMHMWSYYLAEKCAPLYYSQEAPFTIYGHSILGWCKGDLFGWLDIWAYFWLAVGTSFIFVLFCFPSGHFYGLIDHLILQTYS